MSEEIYNFLDFVRAQSEGRKVDSKDAFVMQLQESIDEIKQSREMGEVYMGLKEWLEDEYEDGRSVGIEEGRVKGRAEGIAEIRTSLIKKKLAKGVSIEEIADFLEEDISVITAIAEDLKS